MPESELLSSHTHLTVVHPKAQLSPNLADQSLFPGYEADLDLTGGMTVPAGSSDTVHACTMAFAMTQEARRPCLALPAAATCQTHTHALSLSLPPLL